MGWTGNKRRNLNAAPLVLHPRGIRGKDDLDLRVVDEVGVEVGVDMEEEVAGMVAEGEEAEVVGVVTNH